MHAGLFRFESLRPAEFSRPFSARTAKIAVETFQSRLFWLPAILIAGLCGWMMLSGYGHDNAANQPVGRTDLAAVTADQPVQSPDPGGIAAPFDPATAPGAREAHPGHVPDLEERQAGRR